ncbi:MAG: aquaporin family protein [Chloroflexota bacterium]|nr:aquaporin family protein [Chloroflexota bacterium]
MRRSGLSGELMAEFLGTMVLIIFGDGVVAMVVALGKGDYQTITWAWGLAVVMGVYVAGGLSGAHLNPAVTLALAVRKGFAWSKVLPYMGAQVLGAFCGAGLLLLNYNPGIAAFEKAHNIVRDAASGTPGTAGIWSTYPNMAAGIQWGNALFDQIIGTALLVAVIFAITDKRNQPVESNLAPFIIGLLVVVIGMSMGGNAGYAINPARDFGPRLLSSIGGWGANPFTFSADLFGISLPYFLVPIIGPLVGGVIGGYVYDFGINQFLLNRGDTEADVQVRGETVIDKASVR